MEDSRTTRAPSSGTPLSREAVLRAAVALADADGIGALSMRNLARALGAGAMSLYHYVANKSELLDGVVDLVVGEIDPPAGRDWREAVRHTARSAHRVLSRHPWAAGLVLSSASLQPARMHYMEGLLGTLRAAGFPAELTHRAYHVLDSYIVGYTLWQVGMNLPAGADLTALGADVLRELPADRFPFLVEHIRQHLAGGGGGSDRSDYEFGLDLILDSLERLREPTGPG